MTDIVVFRGLGSREGAEVFDPLLSSTQAAVQRGKYEIDFNTAKVVHNIEAAYMPSIKLGDVVTVRDSRTDAVVAGVVREFSHVMHGVVMTTSVVLEEAQ